MNSIQIQRVNVQEIVDLRYRVLRAGLPREAAHFDGDHAAGTDHLAAKEQGRVIGCATVLLNPWDAKPACQLRGMAVDPEYQRLGIGGQLLGAVHGIAIEAGVSILWANARKPVAAFYRKHGWEIVSEEFEIPTAGPHFKMIRRVT